LWVCRERSGLRKKGGRKERKKKRKVTRYIIMPTAKPLEAGGWASLRGSKLEREPGWNATRPELVQCASSLRQPDSSGRPSAGVVFTFRIATNMYANKLTVTVFRSVSEQAHFSCVLVSFRRSSLLLCSGLFQNTTTYSWVTWVQRLKLRRLEKLLRLLVKFRKYARICNFSI
jgi:hypothetical protein